MLSAKNERGSVLVFVTLMIVLLLVMVGMGLDTGHLVYIRAQGQPAVDAAALAAAAAIPSNTPATVNGQAAAFNSKNDYLNSPNNALAASNVTLIKFDRATQTITQATGVSPSSVGNANGARVALESSNPYGGSVGAPMNSPLFLTPLFKLMGQSAPGTANVSVSAVAVIQAVAGMPIAIQDDLCGTNATLNFQGGGNSGWETYYIGNASTTVIRNFFEAIPNCQGQPAVETGYCGNLNNGVITTLFNKNIQDMYNADPSAWYLIPVVSAGAISNGNFNQCSPITDWAKIQLDKTDPFNNSGSQKGQLRATVVCGQSPYTSKDTKCFVPRLVRDTKSGM